MYFLCFDFRGELGFLNCDDICMCVVNNQFELLESVDTVVAMTVVHVLLFLLHVCMLR